MKKQFYHGILLAACIAVVLAGGCNSDDQRKTNDPETGGFSIFPTSYTFPIAYFEYAAQDGKTVEITNNGTSAISVAIALTGTDAQSFILSADTLDISSKGVESFSITPKNGLGIKTHRAAVTMNADSGDSKTLNVNFIVENNFHVYIAFGQSNMQGPGPIRDVDKTFEHYDRWQTLNVVAGSYGGASGTGVINRAKGQWYDAIPPLIISGDLKHWQNDFTTGLGPSDYFGRTLVEKLPANVKIGVVAVANGDWALASFRKEKAAEYYDAANGNGSNGKESGRPSSTERQGWTRYTGAGANYESPYDAIIKNAEIAQETGVIKGIIVHQGESGRGMTDITWENMLKEIYDDLISDLNLDPNIPILLGQTWNAGTGNTNGYLNTDNRIQNIIPNAWVISSAGLNKGRPVNDNLHFGSEDLEGLGTRYGEKMFELNYKQ